jgi:arabinose 5-phosphate isomerase
MLLAPTSSTVNTLMLGDALAMAVMQARGFNEEDFARSHRRERWVRVCSTKSIT